jgi:hypothetical protein
MRKLIILAILIAYIISCPEGLCGTNEKCCPGVDGGFACCPVGFLEVKENLGFPPIDDLMRCFNEAKVTASDAWTIIQLIMAGKQGEAIRHFPKLEGDAMIAFEDCKNVFEELK